MKIVHLLTSLTGGAANAAIRLNEALIGAGHDSQLISVSRRNNQNNVSQVSQHLSFKSQLASSAVTYSQSKLVQKDANLVTPISIDLLQWQNTEIESADVIHLHAFYNLVSIRNFLYQYPSKLKVVTLHDERFYTGGCHYTGTCSQVSTGCRSCPQVRKPFKFLIKNARKKIVQDVHNFPNLIFVCPSEWIFNRVKKAFPDLPAANFKKIYNPIPVPERLLSAPLLSKPQINLGFISQDLENPLKNLDLLLRAFDRVNDIYPDKFHLTLVGNSNSNYALGNPLITQTGVRSNLELQEVFSKIDVLVVPSISDNLPNVIAEALMSGVNILGSNVGGIPELLGLFEQRVFESQNEDELVQVILDFEVKDKSILKKKSASVFGYSAISTEVVNVYIEGLKRIDPTKNRA